MRKIKYKVVELYYCPHCWRLFSTMDEMLKHGEPCDSLNAADLARLVVEAKRESK